MAVIKCTNCGAILKPKDPIAAGKKVKCPKCQQPFIVQAEEEIVPDEPVKKPKPADDEADTADGDGVAEGMPSASKKGKGKPTDDDDESDSGAGKKKSKGSEPGKKNNTMLIVGIVVGVLLLCCCLPSCVGTIMNWGAIMGANALKGAVQKDLIFKDNPFKDIKDVKDNPLKDMPAFDGKKGKT